MECVLHYPTCNIDFVQAKVFVIILTGRLTSLNQFPKIFTTTTTIIIIIVIFFIDILVIRPRVPDFPEVVKGNAATPFASFV